MQSFAALRGRDGRAGAGRRALARGGRGVRRRRFAGADGAAGRLGEGAQACPRPSCSPSITACRPGSAKVARGVVAAAKAAGLDGPYPDWKGAKPKADIEAAARDGPLPADGRTGAGATDRARSMSPIRARIRPRPFCSGWRAAAGSTGLPRMQAPSRPSRCPVSRTLRGAPAARIAAARSCAPILEGARHRLDRRSDECRSALRPRAAARGLAGAGGGWALRPRASPMPPRHLARARDGAGGGDGGVPGARMPAFEDGRCLLDGGGAGHGAARDRVCGRWPRCLGRVSGAALPAAFRAVWSGCSTQSWRALWATARTLHGCRIAPAPKRHAPYSARSTLAVVPGAGRAAITNRRREIAPKGWIVDA